MHLRAEALVTSGAEAEARAAANETAAVAARVCGTGSGAHRMSARLVELLEARQICARDNAARLAVVQQEMEAESRAAQAAARDDHRQALAAVDAASARRIAAAEAAEREAAAVRTAQEEGRYATMDHGDAVHAARVSAAGAVRRVGCSVARPPHRAGLTRIALQSAAPSAAQAVKRARAAIGEALAAQFAAIEAARCADSGGVPPSRLELPALSRVHPAGQARQCGRRPSLRSNRRA